MNRTPTNISASADLQIFDAVPAPIFVKDREHRFVYLNNSMCQLMEIDGATFIGKTDYDFFPKEEADIFRATDEEAFASGKALVNEEQLTSASGKIYTIITTKTIHRGADNEPLLVGAIKDISQERELQRKHENLIRMLHNTEELGQIGGWEIDLVNNIHTWTDQIYKIYGLPVCETPTMELALKPYGTGGIPRVQAAINAARSDGASYRFELPFTKYTGEQIWVEALGVPVVENGVTTKLTGAFRDVSAKVLAEEEMRRARETLEIALEAAQIGVWDWYPQSGAARFSDRWKAMLGYGPTEIEDRGSSFFELLYPEDREKVEAGVKRYFSGELPSYSVEFRARTKSGRYIWIASIGKATAFDSSGAPTRMTGVHIDIHQQKTNELELQLSKDLAERASITKSEFLANMSHELRTPMNGVLGIAALLRDTQINADQKDLIECLISSGQTLLSVINDILDMSKIEAGKMEIELRPTNIRELLTQLCRPLAVQAEQRKIQFVPNIDPAIPDFVLADGLRIQQVVINLISNALKFTPEGGGILLGVSCLNVSETSALLRFQVSDSGIGISPEAQSRIFNAFEQADGGITRQYGGTGLGLTISARLVKLMGSTLQLRSREDQGTTFFFEIESPVAKPAEAIQNIAHTTKEPLYTPKLRILVAEDNSVNRRVIERMLQKLGHSVTLVENGQLALDLHKKEMFDLILMDIQMPVMDGESATKAIRSGQTRPNIPIVALTAHALHGDRERYLASGMTGYISKPVDLESLRAELHRVTSLPFLRTNLRTDS